MKLGEQTRLPGNELIAPRDAGIFLIPRRLNESLTTVLPLVAMSTESISLEFDTLGGKVGLRVWAVALQV